MANEDVKNIYAKITNYYAKKEETILVPQKWLDGFFRDLFWQGVAEKKILVHWSNLKMFLSFTEEYADFLLEYRFKKKLLLHLLPPYVYSEFVRWIGENKGRNFTKQIEKIRMIFETILLFFKYLIKRKMILNCQNLQMAMEIMLEDKKIRFIEELDDVLVENLVEHLTEQLAIDEKSALIEETEFSELMGVIYQKIEVVFKSKKHEKDFIRALTLFFAPFGPEDIEKQEDDDKGSFWYLFWDYVFFEYRMLENDIKTLAYFQESKEIKWNKKEKFALKELLSLNFVCFGVQKKVNDHTFECINLLTEEKFFLPSSFIENQEVKKKIFFARMKISEISCQFFLLGNAEVSRLLRRRIKQEVDNYFSLFAETGNNIKIKDFLGRHFLLVKNIIQMVGKQKIYVDSNLQRGKKIKYSSKYRLTCEIILESIKPVLERCTLFSVYDYNLMKRIMMDFLVETKMVLGEDLRKLFGIAVLCVYIYVNEIRLVNIEEVLMFSHEKKIEVEKMADKIMNQLLICEYDVRYLNEEGFVNYFYSLEEV